MLMISKVAIDAAARRLDLDCDAFTENFKQFANDVSPDIRAVSPRTA